MYDVANPFICPTCASLHFQSAFRAGVKLFAAGEDKAVDLLRSSESRAAIEAAGRLHLNQPPNFHP